MRELRMEKVKERSEVDVERRDQGSGMNGRQ